MVQWLDKYIASGPWMAYGANGSWQSLMWKEGKETATDVAVFLLSNSLHQDVFFSCLLRCWQDKQAHHDQRGSHQDDGGDEEQSWHPP